MRDFSIGEVEQITSIKAHILRYWEEVIPSISPKKDIGGRRLYSSKDVQLLLRLKYLIYTKKFTIEGARDQLINELTDFDSDSYKPEIIYQLSEIKSELLDLYGLILKKKAQKGANND
jgi:DNA-binding transcriptional MerR regulator